MKPEARYQFGFKTLFLLTAVVAVICSIAMWLGGRTLPASLFVILTSFYVIWGFFRGPYLYRSFQAAQKRRKSLRAKLQNDLEQRKRVLESNPTVSDKGRPRGRSRQ